MTMPPLRQQLEAILRAWVIFVDGAKVPFEKRGQITVQEFEIICQRLEALLTPPKPDRTQLWNTLLRGLPCGVQEMLRTTSSWDELLDLIMAWATRRPKPEPPRWCPHWQATPDGWKRIGQEKDYVLGDAILSDWDQCPVAGCHATRPPMRVG